MLEHQACLMEKQLSQRKPTWAFLRKFVLDYIRRYGKHSDKITLFRHFTELTGNKEHLICDLP